MCSDDQLLYSSIYNNIYIIPVYIIVYIISRRRAGAKELHFIIITVYCNYTLDYTDYIESIGITRYSTVL